ncbi:hypothetical protein HI914_02009 [Erysiphe necator]|nr:hypothetical protein HI914_02009 [Erysiphe necator]
MSSTFLSEHNFPLLSNQIPRNSRCFCLQFLSSPFSTKRGIARLSQEVSFLNRPGTGSGISFGASLRYFATLVLKKPRIQAISLYDFLSLRIGRIR